MTAPEPLFTPRDREILARLVEVALPAGDLLPPPDAGFAERLERILAGVGSHAPRAWRGLLRALDTATALRRGRRFSHLRPERRIEVLRAWEGREATHALLRGLLFPLKAAYFSGAGVYGALGCRHRVEPPVAAEAPAWLGRVQDGDALAPGEVLECDVAVVGTGAGGAPIADELATRGHAVLLLEEGRLFTRRDFTGRPYEAMEAMYVAHGATFTLGNPLVVLPLGRTVGGSTTINSGTCLRPRPSLLREWREAHGLTDLTDTAMEGLFERVEAALRVEVADGKHVGATGRVVARGCEALGWRHHPLPRNAPDCDGQGLCCFGCPTDAKRGTNLSYVPSALAQGAWLVTGARVDAVDLEGGRAAGVRGRILRRDGTQAPFSVRARAVVLAAGAIGTPPLLWRSGLGRGLPMLGRNLSIHPSSHAFAVFDEPIDASRSIPQGYCVDEFEDEGLLFEGGTPPIEVPAVDVARFGRAYMEFMSRWNHLAAFGFMLKDTSRGRLLRDGRGGAIPFYRLNRRDTGRLSVGMGRLCRLFLAAGAREVHTGVQMWPVVRDAAGVRALERARLPARRFEMSAYHPLGTARMGVGPERSVVGPDNEVHGVRSLFVCDGSALPGPTGVNPQVTIMAISLRAAVPVGRRLEGP